MKQKRTGYILHQRAVGNTSRLLTILSADAGIEHCFLMHPNSKRQKRFQNTSAFSYAQFEIEWQIKGQCWIIKEMNVLKNWMLLEQSLYLYYQISLWSEVIIKSKAHDEKEKIFSLFHQKIEHITQTKNRQQALHEVLLFFYHFNEIAGLVPDLSRCQECFCHAFKALFIKGDSIVCERCRQGNEGLWLSKVLCQFLHSVEPEKNYLKEPYINNKSLKAGSRFLIFYTQKQLDQTLITLKNWDFF